MILYDFLDIIMFLSIKVKYHVGWLHNIYKEEEEKTCHIKENTWGKWVVVCIAVMANSYREMASSIIYLKAN